jgi:hypothetical protein
MKILKCKIFVSVEMQDAIFIKQHICEDSKYPPGVYTVPTSALNLFKVVTARRIYLKLMLIICVEYQVDLF